MWIGIVVLLVVFLFIVVVVVPLLEKRAYGGTSYRQREQELHNEIMETTSTQRLQSYHKKTW